MTEPLNWDEFRIVNAIAVTHSLSGAAERLRLNHSTMFRRLTALETRLGFKLFERGRAGYVPTPAGEDMVALALLMGDTIAEFERRVGGKDAQFTGRVRLAVCEAIGGVVLPRIIADFRRAYPGLLVELTFSEAPLDCLATGADLALSALIGPADEAWSVRRLATLSWGVFAAPSLIPPGAEARLASAPWVAPTEQATSPQARRWLDRNVEPSRYAAQAGSLLATAELAACGVGAALLPCFLAELKPALRKLGETGDGVESDLCVAATPQALRRAHVRALYDFVGDEIERNRACFEGAPAP